MSSKLALVFGIALAACAGVAQAVSLNSNGTGQVLVFPYYTVKGNQQTMLSVANTTQVGKVVKVRFREAYNGRAVLDFNLYLSPLDVWTANVFALADAGVDGDGAALFSTDSSCTDPPLNASGVLANGSRYLDFSHAAYTGANADTGPDGDARLREGHIEMILMSDVVPDSALAHATTHVNGVPHDCAVATLRGASGYAAPTEDPLDGAAGTHADGGLFGAASIVDVAGGVFYAYNADALDGFSYVSLYTPPGDAQPTLASVNDRDNANAATARMLIDGEQVSATFPGATPGSRAVDAVSAVFAANFVENEYFTSLDHAIDTDWVITFPTKHLYVDAQPGGAIAGATAVSAPFDQLFTAGGACLWVEYNAMTIVDREEAATWLPYCGFSAGCPPGAPLGNQLCRETNVFVIATDPSTSDPVLASSLVIPATAIPPLGGAGWIRWDMSSRHQLSAASNGAVFHGLPLTGFAAVKYVNGTLPLPGGQVLANYSGVYHHRSTTVCTNGNSSCM